MFSLTKLFRLPDGKGKQADILYGSTISMDTADLASLVEELESNIDDLEDTLIDLIDSPISTSAAKLSTIDRAKLLVLVTYAIESLIFSHVRLNGADGKAHPVFKELARVKQYFEKINAVENPVRKRENLSLNKPAAGRFIKAALSGNEKYDQEREVRQAANKQAAQVRLEQISKKTNARAVKTSAEELDSSNQAEGIASESQEIVDVAMKTKRRKQTPASDDVEGTKKRKKE